LSQQIETAQPRKKAVSFLTYCLFSGLNCALIPNLLPVVLLFGRGLLCQVYIFTVRLLAGSLAFLVLFQALVRKQM
jgi:hypothetical protein